MSDPAIERVLAAIARPREPLEGSAAEVLSALTRGAEPGLSALDGAVLRATRADRLGYAFAAGYVAAGRTLAARIGVALPEHSRVALAASEEGGAHPRAIHTEFDGHALSGVKVWITLALEATHLLVIAKAGEAGGRPRLIAACVPSEREGLHVEELPEAPFCPEIRHARLTLKAVPVAPEELLPVDGFADVLRPFRTIEDLCVQATALAWLGATAVRLGMPRELAARAAAIVLSLREVAELDASSRLAHVALGGALELAGALLEDLAAAWPAQPAEARARFERDRPLFKIAARARAERLAKAWAELAGG